MKLLKGIYPPITTPFRKNDISLKDLELNLSKYEQNNLSGYVVGGSNGETVFLTEKEKIDLFRTVREQVADEKKVIAGTGLESIKSTIKLTNFAADEGVDYALIVTPHFFANEMTHQAFINYFTAVADNIKIPLIIYNVSKFTYVNISVETIAELSKHKNIIGLKNSNTDVEELSKTINTVSDDFAILAGTGSILLPALKVGANGGVLALADIAPAECIQIYDLFIKDNLIEAEKLQFDLIPVNQAITSTYGVAGLKAALDLVGFYGGEPRLPLEPLDLNKIYDLKKILVTASLIK